MKKMIRRTAAMAISAFMAAQYIPFTALALDNTHCDLTINPYIISDSAYGNLNDGNHNPSGTTSPDSTQASGTDGAAAQTGMQFNVLQVDANGDTVLYGGNPVYSQTATAGTKLENIPDGKYKITPITNQTETDTKFKNAEAFYIQLPATSRDVVIYPKFTDNNDTGDDTTGTNNPVDPSTSLHSIKLTKTLTGGTGTPPAWQPDSTASNPFYAEFDAYFKNGLGKWEKANTTGSYRTNANGEVIIDGLPLGEYCLVEKTAPNGYLLNQKPVMFNLTGSATGANASVQTGTLDNDKELTVAKDIAYTTEGNGYGKTYKWTITADVPSHPENLIKYEITDDFTNLKNVAFSIEGFTENTDYTVATSGTKKTISITDPTALTGTSLVISVTSELADGVAENTAVTNKASIEYSYAYDPGTNDPTDIPEPDPTDPTNPANPKEYPTDPSNPPTDTVATFTPKTITISNVDSTNTSTELTGSFDITNFSIHVDDSSDAATLDDGDKTDSLLTLKDLAPGKYTITQKSTAAGYSIASPDSKTIFIAEDGKVYEGTDATGTEISVGSDGSYKITFLNAPITSGFNLPFTGTTATIVFSITGILLMAGTAFFIFIIFKKRDDDEEEQENN